MAAHRRSRSSLREWRGVTADTPRAGDRTLAQPAADSWWKRSVKEIQQLYAKSAVLVYMWVPFGTSEGAWPLSQSTWAQRCRRDHDAREGDHETSPLIWWCGAFPFYVSSSASVKGSLTPKLRPCFHRPPAVGWPWNGSAIMPHSSPGNL